MSPPTATHHEAEAPPPGFERVAQAADAAMLLVLTADPYVDPAMSADLTEEELRGLIDDC